MSWSISVLIQYDYEPLLLSSIVMDRKEVDHNVTKDHTTYEENYVTRRNKRDCLNRRFVTLVQSMNQNLLVLLSNS